MSSTNQKVFPPAKGGSSGSAGTGGFIYRSIDHLSDYLVSLAFLMPVFFAFMGYRYYEIVTLFENSLVSMITDADSRQTAAVLIALVGIFATLIFMVHSDKMAIKIGNLDPYAPKGFSPSTKGDAEGRGVVHWSKLLLVLYAFVINAFFWKPWDGANQHDTAFRWFCCVMLSSMDYGFAHLFKALRKERGLERQLTDIEGDIQEAQHDYESIQSSIGELRSKHAETLEKYRQYQQAVKEATCPYCQKIFPTGKRGVNAHKEDCPSKPITE